ncbi:MAG TPA: hypothetical protein VHY91_03865 [Pirellulales bacterium]|jgi:hypothetical protein|nr:hypothetical protein [Pirellulales bacterium]
MPRTSRPNSPCQWFAAGVLATTASIVACWIGLAWPPVGLVAAAESGQRAFSQRPATAVPHSSTVRQREGTALVDVPGYFKLTGDRATFFPTGSDAHYMGLENLNLERIATAISDIPEQIPWIVSGMITEYRGANYLLVTKAILQNAPSAPGRTTGAAEPANLSSVGQGF